MPSYLVNEGGERTHVVLTVDEYEQLKKTEARLESVRSYAMEMISAIGQEDQTHDEHAREEHAREEHAREEHAHEGHAHEEQHAEAAGESHERAWYQRS